MYRTPYCRALTLLLLALCCLSSAACSRASLNLEAQIVYSMGGPQPVARQTFYLLDADLKEIPRLKSKDVKAEDKTAIQSMAALIALLYVAESGKDLQKKTAAEAFYNSKPFWESNIVQIAETDFKGEAAFENLQPGDYWVVGIVETRSGLAFWNYKVTVKPGENKVLLDQNNALYAK